VFGHSFANHLETKVSQNADAILAPEGVAEGTNEVARGGWHVPDRDREAPTATPTLTVEEPQGRYLITRRAMRASLV
jgi:hypothetical protein